MDNINFLDAFESDLDAEKNGIEVEINGGVTIRVKSGSYDINEDLKKAMLAEFKNTGKSYRNAIEFFQVEKNINKIKMFFSKHVLIGWSGMKDRQGDEILYSSEKAYEFFINPKMRSFWELVQKVSTDEQVFLSFNSEDLKEDLKNA